MSPSVCRSAGRTLQGAGKQGTTLFLLRLNNACIHSLFITARVGLVGCSVSEVNMAAWCVFDRCRAASRVRRAMNRPRAWEAWTVPLGP